MNTMASSSTTKPKCGITLISFGRKGKSERRNATEKRHELWGRCALRRRAWEGGCGGGRGARSGRQGDQPRGPYIARGSRLECSVLAICGHMVVDPRLTRCVIDIVVSGQSLHKLKVGSTRYVMNVTRQCPSLANTSTGARVIVVKIRVSVMSMSMVSCGCEGQGEWCPRL